MQRLSVAHRLGRRVARCAERGENESVNLLCEVVKRGGLFGLDITEIIEKSDPELYQPYVGIELVDATAEGLARRCAGSTLGPCAEVHRRLEHPSVEFSRLMRPLSCNPEMRCAYGKLVTALLKR